ncbi:MAG: response regulator transcription factor [Acidaminobacteraceae bacterium]
MKRILIIEDDKSIARLQKDYLEINGYDVIVEHTGDYNTIMGMMRDVDLLILDLMLPKGDGFTICKALRSDYNIPIIIISAMDQEKDIILGLGFGADDYMIKPFVPNQLVARVRSQLSRFERLTKLEGKPKDNVIIIRSLSIDEDKRECQIDGIKVDLTPKEFDIVLFLARNKGKVFSKSFIYERIWKVESFGDLSTVSVHIRRVREKISAINKDIECIETIWGVGYKIV